MNFLFDSRPSKKLKTESGGCKPRAPSTDNYSLMKDKYVLAENGYTVGRKIDSGTFAVVRYAEKSTTNGSTLLAVKIIDKAKASPLFIEKFLGRELDIWPRLRHRHIIQVDRMFQIQERIYVFMELAAGGSVIEFVQRHGAIEEDMAKMWSRNMCQGLRYCHKKGVAHRDLKCDNLLLDKNLQVKIGDFGFCCKSVNSATRLPIYSTTYCGSSSYVAPEVIEGQPYDPISADIWSAGICIFVILNNAMPFDDSNIRQMHDDQVTKNWSYTSKCKNKLSQSAKRLISRMLEPLPSERPSMDEILSCTWMRRT
ncbi:testis-specific serine/threonine-protein kinase 2-like [Parasteatoda tepidariorum]|uniref:testis-specific serine/threonine-protein kinase 2-like n=1 Tax=Parasteatoda tepidariorum TaxID=114398 RepID=UPI00077FE426